MKQKVFVQGREMSPINIYSGYAYRKYLEKCRCEEEREENTTDEEKKEFKVIGNGEWNDYKAEAWKRKKSNKGIANAVSFVLHVYFIFKKV